jgi:hypothetical protein
MKRRIYKLKTNFTLLGMDGADWGILIGTFAFSINFLQSTLGSKAALFFSIVCTALVYFVWHLVKDKVPERFMKHFFSWLAEPEVYRVMPDTKNIPLVVNFKKAQTVSKVNKKQAEKSSWRMPTGRPDSWL